MLKGRFDYTDNLKASFNTEQKLRARYDYIQYLKAKMVIPFYESSSKPVSVYNIDDGTGNWGKYIIVKFDYPVSNLENNAHRFIITDGYGLDYIGHSIEAIDDITIKIVYYDFNGAYGTDCILTYVPGTVQSQVVPLDAFLFEFTPINLIPPPPGEPVNVYNPDNISIIIEFNRAVVCEDWTALESAFNVSGFEYNYIPEGTLQPKTYIIDNIGYEDEDNKRIIKINLTVQGRMKYPQDVVTVNYDSDIGNLISAGSKVNSFDVIFNPENITQPVFNPNAPENVEVVNITATSNLIRIYYSSFQSGDENIEVTNITATGVLTHIDDL